MAENMEALEREIAALIREHVEIGYELLPGGVVNPDSIGVSAYGAAHVVVHRLRKEFCSADHGKETR